MAPSFELFSLEGRIALITGSSQGIGFALARGLAEHGATVIINGRDQNKVNKAVTLLEDEGHTVFASVFDVTVAEEVRAAIDAIEEEIGALDILVNNAGMQYRAPLEDFPIEKWQQLLETNISSAFYAGRQLRAI
jgi:gluconate 5-dehydrogenase